MKSDRHTYIADRPPACKSDFGFAGRTTPEGINTRWVRKPMGNDSPNNHYSRLIEYNDWLRQEEKKYSWLLKELKKARWLTSKGPTCGGFTRHVSPCGGFIQSSPQRDDASSVVAEFDVDRMLDELVSSELETTRLTGDEVRNGCGLTMEQALLKHKKPPALEKDECSSRNSTQQAMTFQYTLSVREQKISRSPMIEEIQAACSKLSESIERESIIVNRLWLEVSKTYSNYSEYDSTAAINSAGPEASKRFGNLYSRHSWRKSFVPIPWDLVMVESVRLVLQRWRGVCSFSQTMCSTRSDEESHLVYDLRSKKRSRPGE